MDYFKRVANQANTAVICSYSDGMGFLSQAAYQQ